MLSSPCLLLPPPRQAEEAHASAAELKSKLEAKEAEVAGLRSNATEGAAKLSAKVAELAELCVSAAEQRARAEAQAAQLEQQLASAAAQLAKQQGILDQWRRVRMLCLHSWPCP